MTRLVVKKVGTGKLFAGGRVERVTNFRLHIWGQTAPFAGFRDHLKGNIFCGGRDQISIGELVLFHNAGNRLFT